MTRATDAASWVAVPTHGGIHLIGPDGCRPVPLGALNDDRSPATGIPLAVDLSRTDIEAIMASGSLTPTAGATAATHYGPSSQEKLDNEDFALAARVSSPLSTWSVAIVADGVSTRTFWSSRSSRIACLAALQVVRGWVENEEADADCLSEERLETLQLDLRQHLTEAMRADQQALRTEGRTPPAWKPERFAKWSERDALWYATTLLVTAVGPRGGVVLSCGDGAVVVERSSSNGTVESAKVLLETDDDVRLSTVVSLDTSRMQFVCARIRPGSPGHSIRVILATDGVDRGRVVLGEDPVAFYGSETHAIEPSSPWDTIHRVLDQPEPEPDNHSVGVAWCRTGPVEPQPTHIDVPQREVEVAPIVVRRRPRPLPRIAQPAPDVTGGDVIVAILCALWLPYFLFLLFL